MDKLVFKVDNQKYLYSAKLQGIYKITKETDYDSFERDNYQLKQQSNKRNPNNDVLPFLQFISAQTCNMKCTYCYANDGKYYEVNKKILDFEDYKKTFLGVIDIFSKGVRAISFFGGEPLLGFSHIKKFVNYVNSYCSDNDLKPPRFGIITNATLMNNEIAEFICSNNINLTISLDGIAKINDQNRVMKNNTGSYQKIIQAIRLIKSKNSKIQISIEGTLPKNMLGNISKEDHHRYVQVLNDLGVTTYVIVPEFCVGDCYSEEDLVQIKNFYCNVVDLTFEQLCKNTTDNCVSMDIISIINSLVNGGVSRDCGAGYAFTVSTDLKMYSCQALMLDHTLPQYELTDAKSITDFMSSDFNREMQNATRFSVDECAKCFAKNVCGVWCRGLNKVENGAIKSVIKSRCFVQRVITERVLKNLISTMTDNSKSSLFTANYKKQVKTFSQIKSGLH